MDVFEEQITQIVLWYLDSVVRLPIVWSVLPLQYGIPSDGKCVSWLSYPDQDASRNSESSWFSELLPLHGGNGRESGQDV